MIGCYEYRNDDIVLSSDSMTDEQWAFICEQFGFLNPENVFDIIIKSYDVDVYRWEAGK